MDQAEASARGAARSLAAVREQRPLVHNITNIVVANTTANALLAIGASPAMLESPDEVEDMVAVADGLVVNLGTISSPQTSAMKLAVARARERRLPWVLDPVAVGALGYRRRVAIDLLASGPQAVRGNAAEIMSLAGLESGAKGPDSLEDATSATPAALQVAKSTGAVVAVTGAVDRITDGERVIEVANGNPLMADVTGTGCTATAIVGAFLAVERDPLVAVTHGLTVFAVAGEVAAERARGPGSFQVELFDALYGLDSSTIVDRARIRPAPHAALPS